MKVLIIQISLPLISIYYIVHLKYLRSWVFANSFGDPLPDPEVNGREDGALHTKLKSLCELLWLSLLYERPL